MKKMMMVSLLLLAGCQQLMHGQMQPVKQTDLKNGIYFTTCSGAAEDWASCNDKALRTCAGNYSVIEKHENVIGARRELKFQCKK